jgi:hypothetical protein
MTIPGLGPVTASAMAGIQDVSVFSGPRDTGVDGLLTTAIALKEEALVNEHIKSASTNAKDLDDNSD